MNCYILTGGVSRRMGRSKLDLPFAGSTFLARVVAAAAPVFEKVVAVQRHGGGAIEGMPTIEEMAGGVQAPVAGIVRALEDAGDDCFILAADYPLITTGILRFLRERFEETQPPMLVPMWRDRPQLLCSGYASALMTALRQRIHQGRLDLRSLLEEANGEIIREALLRSMFPGEPLMNVNTPEELQEAERLYEQS